MVYKDICIQDLDSMWDAVYLASKGFDTAVQEVIGAIKKRNVIELNEKMDKLGGAMGLITMASQHGIKRTIEVK